MSVRELEEQVASTSVGSHGVMTVPFFNGERTPNLPNAKGCIFGLDESNYTPENMLRSAMESAVFGLRSGLDTLRQLGCHIDTVHLTGGGAGSDVWRQMVSDVFDLPVSVQTSDEGAALGAALQALWMFHRLQGQNASLQALLDEHLIRDPMRSCVPNKYSVQEYKLFYVEYLRQVETMRTLYD